MKKVILIAALLSMIFGDSFAIASVARSVQADTIFPTGGSALTVPSTGTAILSDASSLAASKLTGQVGVANGGTGASTLTANSVVIGNGTSAVNLAAPVQYQALIGNSSGAPSFQALPLNQSAAVTGSLGVANGGTGAATLTANGILQGNGTSAVTAITGSQYQVLTYGSGGVPAAGAVTLNQAAAVTGQLGVANGGTGASTLTAGSVVVGNGTSAVSLVAPGTSGNVLTSNGSTWVSSAPASSGGSANVVASAASPQSVTAAGGVTVTGQITNGPNVVFIQGSAGAVTVTATPSITACTAAGEQLQLIGESATNTVTLQDNAGLAGSKLQLNGNITMGLNATLLLVCDAASGNWVELSRR